MFECMCGVRECAVVCRGVGMWMWGYVDVVLRCV